MLKREQKYSKEDLILKLKCRGKDLNINIGRLIYKVIKDNPDIKYQNRKMISELIRNMD